MRCGLLGRKLGHSYSPQIHAMLGSYPYHLYEKEPEEVADFLKNGDLTVFNKRVRVDSVSLNSVKQMSYEIEIAYLFHVKGYIIASLKFNAVYIVFLGVSLDKLAQSSE